MVDILKFFRQRNVRVIVGTVIGTTIYCMAVVWILDLGEFYAGGITGVSQLVTTLFDKFGLVVRLSIVIGLFNIPLFLIGWKQVSRRFAYLSLISIVLQVIIIFVLEVIDFSPLASLKDEKLLLAIIGGLLTGVGSGICLRSGSSSGGMDILAQYVSLKKNISFIKFALLVDFVIICLGGLLAQNINVAIFTVVRLLTHIVAIDKIHTVYNLMKITIYTEKKDEMREALIDKFNHGITIYQAMGAYTKKIRWVLETVVSRYEIEEYRNIAKQIDKNVFMTYTSVSGVEGSFNRNVIT